MGRVAGGCYCSADRAKNVSRAVAVVFIRYMCRKLAIFGAADLTMCFVYTGRFASRVSCVAGGCYCSAGRTKNVGSAVAVVCLGGMFCKIAVLGAADLTLCFFSAGRFATRVGRVAGGCYCSTN